MFKTFATLFRSAAATAEESLIDRNALLILDQQIREARSALERGRHALAIAMAQDDAEGKRLDDTRRHIADLEQRATEALRGGRDDLAEEAAEVIAALEADGTAIAEAQMTFATEARRLKRHVANAQQRFSEIERGRRLAQAAEAVRKLKTSGGLTATGSTPALANAEASLKRLRARQIEDAAVEAHLQTIDEGSRARTVSERLEAQGFGQRTRPTSSDILARLKARTSAEPTLQAREIP